MNADRVRTSLLNSFCFNIGVYLRLSAAELQYVINDIYINPLLVFERGAVAIDALIVRR